MLSILIVFFQRIKNNLQGLWSLIQLEKQRHGCGTCRSRLDALEGRIQVMAEIHKSLYASEPVSKVEIGSQLRTLCDSVAECGVRVLLRVPIAGSIPRRVGDQIYRLVQEGLSNAIRHAQATTLRVDLFLLPHRIQLVVADDGRGFPFQGTYNLQTLNARGLGPVSIKERVATLKGELTLVSSADGSRLTIALPRMRAPMTSSLHTSIS